MNVHKLTRRAARAGNARLVDALLAIANADTLPGTLTAIGNAEYYAKAAGDDKAMRELARMYEDVNREWERVRVR